MTASIPSPQRPPSHLRRIALSVLLSALLAGSGLAQAENRALIMTIGGYPAPNTLPGIDQDARMARRIAVSMGVPDGNILELSDGSLSLAGFRAALARLAELTTGNDKVFIYYSGHGRQEPSPDGQGCTQGLVSIDLQTFQDQELGLWLNKIAARSGQLVMMNDSCFSGGASGLRSKGLGDAEGVAKVWRSGNEGSRAGDPGYRCGRPVNFSKMFRDLYVEKASPHLVYISASRDDEVSRATEVGSVATLAWNACIQDPAADTDHSGVLSAAELESCAQRWIDGHHVNQHVTVVGQDDLPVSTASANPDGAGVPDADGNALSVLNDLRAGGNPSFAVRLLADHSAMRIGVDELSLRGQTSQAGYLYVFHAGTSNGELTLLFPNQFDGNNYVEPGGFQLPSNGRWRVKAGGPAGTSHVIALISPQKLDLKSLKQGKSPFANCNSRAGDCSKLYVEGTSGAGYGASEIIAVREVANP